MSGSNGWGYGGDDPYDPHAPRQQHEQHPDQQQQQYEQQHQQQYGYDDTYGGGYSDQQGQQQGQGYYDTYAGQYQQVPQTPQSPPPNQYEQQYGAQYAQPQPSMYDTGQTSGAGYDTAQFQAGQFDTGQQWAVPQQNPQHQVPGQRQPGADEGGGQDPYETGQFAFAQEDTEKSEDAIDWLKFAETRSERRDEKKRRSRGRVRILAVLLVICLAGGGGWLWWSHRGGSDTAAAAGGGGQRNTIVVTLRDLKGVTSNVMLVDNASAKSGSTLLLPSNLQLPSGDVGTVTMGQSLDQLGPSGTRDALSTLLGANISGSWRLDSPFLSTLVDKVGGITLDADTAISQGGKEVLHKGSNSGVNGATAMAYATYQAKGEGDNTRLARFGQVMDGVLQQMPTSQQGATAVVNAMGAVLDPSLPANKLGASLAALAKERQGGKYRTVSLPVAGNGTLPDGAAGQVVSTVLGTSIKKSAEGAARVTLSNGSGSAKTGSAAQASLTNGGYSMLPGGGNVSVRAKSQIAYTDPSNKADALDIAKTLGLPAGDVAATKAKISGDVAVTIGQDYKPQG
ncbi:hypothetical protein BIV57_09250 [Mangrovactinospora gilvigrisea]|uniref:LytR/CpsA/Psr regulator C-terminal domain-containing protein n=1 Tax=Mangrovactinospora gilvigrisea TaxID=1428644 RepID=A0A1J7C899_9ACTN|nr:LCP family protein [Mangrovactinospora gilvigrisea]OIV37752.1 hypothetical protein BIV57_09250 [Mangrovactinospora gilvigrisea]